MNAASAQSTFTTPVPASVVGPTLLSLLIVDDDRFVRDTCREAASSLGYRASSAESAEQAVRAIESQNIDVVFFDLKQPAAGGLEALQRMKSLRPDLEIIVITGHGTVQTAVQAMKAGAYDFVTKPFTLDELKILLERVIVKVDLCFQLVGCLAPCLRDPQNDSSSLAV